MERYVYVILSRTQTRFARIIRKIGKQTYNHAAISLTCGCKRVYAFSRPTYKAVLLGRLVRESLVRYTLMTENPVPVAVFKVPVSEQEYIWIFQTIQKLMQDPDCIYNLYSVLLYPVAKGFSVNNTFTCIEFAAYLLQHCGYLQKKQCCHYTPDELAEALQAYCIYTGDVRGCLPESEWDNGYFAPFTVRLAFESIKNLGVLTKRTVFAGGHGKT